MCFKTLKEQGKGGILSTKLDTVKKHRKKYQGRKTVLKVLKRF